MVMKDGGCLWLGEYGISCVLISSGVFCFMGGKGVSWILDGSFC